MSDERIKFRGLIAGLPDFPLRKQDGATMEYPRDTQQVKAYLELFNDQVKTGLMLTQSARNAVLEETLQEPFRMAVGDAVNRFLPMMNVATSLMGFRVVGVNNSSNGNDNSGPATTDEEAAEIFKAVVRINDSLTKAMNEGRLDELMNSGAGDELASKGYMVVKTQKDGEDVAGLITHWELRRGYMVDPANPAATLPLPAGIPTLSDWNDTYNKYAKDEIAVERATIGSFVEKFAAQKDNYGFAKDNEIRIFDTEVSDPRRATDLVKLVQQHFPDKKIVYTGVGFKDKEFGKVKAALDKMGIENDLRLGNFADKEELAKGNTYKPKKDGQGVTQPYTPFPEADIVFTSFGAPYMGTHARDGKDAKAMMMKDHGIAIALTNLGNDFTHIKDRLYGHMFRPDGKQVPLHDASYGAIRAVYTNTFDMPKLTEGDWSEFMTVPRAKYDYVPATEPAKDAWFILGKLWHVPPTAFALEERGKVLCAQKHQLELTNNKFSSSMAMTVAPAPGASMQMKEALEASRPAVPLPRNDKPAPGTTPAP
jgi:hypothetical protein